MSFALKLIPFISKVAKVGAPFAVPLVTKVGIPLVGAKVVKNQLDDYMPFILGGSAVVSLGILYVIIR